MKIQSLSGSWKFRQAHTQQWLPATVPGGAHTDLLALGKIPDPFVADNELDCMWVAESDWEYNRTFQIESNLLQEEYIFLVCDGLDTLAEVSINNEFVGKAENMFRQYRWEVKSLLHPGENSIQINFASPVKYGQAKMAVRPLKGVSQAIPGGPYLRKAPCQFGWDWGPMLPPIGIWRDLRLEGRSHARFEDIHLRQSHSTNLVELSAALTIERWTDLPLNALFRVKTPQGQILEITTPVHEKSTNMLMPIHNPQLWYPNGYGAQPLYQVEVALESAGILVDRKTYIIGLRTLELRQEKDEWGKSFTFVVNGIPIFAKGSDWIPTDSFPTRITDEFMFNILKSATETHQNMLRVWGGGFFEDDRFYTFCDQLGILVWQDNIFACSIYPLNDQSYLDNLRVEVIQNVRRIRHHPCLALWCGNNEMEQGWESWSWNTPEDQDLKAAYDTYFHHTLPAWIKELDPDVPYWPSSPSSNTPFINTNGQSEGDAHYWEVWHGRKPFTAYRSQYPRFMSEFGFQALPTLETVKTYAEEKDWNMTSYIMEHHQRSGNGNALMIAQMADNYRMPKDFPSLVYMSNVLQAEGIRYGVEHWRRNKNRVSGVLYWQLNDCWPVASWASLDYYGRWKALHYAAKRFFAPVLLSILDEGERMSIYATSDLECPFNGLVRWFFTDLEGNIIEKGDSSLHLTAQESKLVTTQIFTLNRKEKFERVFIAELWQEGEILIARNLATFVPNKHLNLRQAHISTQLEIKDQTLFITLNAQSLARHVEVKLEGADVVFNDNYFDIPAGTPVVITCPIPQGWNIDRVHQNLRVRSLRDAY